MRKESGLLLSAQRVLRAAIRRSIENPAFAQRFASDEAVDRTWPI
jgi:hypothetical protein